MKTIRTDFIFEIEDFNEDEFREAFKKFLEDRNGELKLYSVDELKSYEELLGL